MEASKVANYRSERGAQAYLEDHRRRLHRRFSDVRERAIIDALLSEGAPYESILDVPSGFGRLLGLLARHTDRVVEADFSETMLALDASLHGDQAAAYLQASALALPLRDRSFDAVVSVRLNHHLSSAADREAHLRELCRVTRRVVVVTFFSSRSLKNRLRQLRSKWNGKPPKHTLAPERVSQVFRECGFLVSAFPPLSRIGSGHVFARAERV